MKKVFIALLVAIGFISFQSSAQIKVDLNIGSQPLWGPTGYNHVDYYYLPDIESYYNVPNKQFMYFDNGRWNTSTRLPARYSTYNLYNGYKVVVNSKDAYKNFDNDKVRYAKYKKVKGQKIIRYSDDPRYYVIKGHPHGMPPGQAKKMYSKRKGSENWKEKGENEEREKDHDNGNKKEGKKGKH